MKKTVIIIFAIVLLFTNTAFSVEYSIIDLTFGGTSAALGINNSGQVVGYSYTTGDIEEHAFLYSGGVMTNLGSLGGTASGAFGINDSGQVVGYSTTTGDTAEHAFLYSGGSMIDLNNLLPTGSGWVLNSATGINDSGQIIGYGYFNGQSRAFVMTVVPEPISSILFLTGGAVLAGRRYLKKKTT
jgi:probable HAF family extracellular repeat protein